MDIRKLVVSAYGTNCYLLADDDTKALAVIDPGDKVTDAVQAACRENGWTLKAIYLTHGHMDHVGGVASLRRAYPHVPTYLHAADCGSGDGMRPTDGIGELTHWQDGDTLTLGNLTVKVLHTPGHTPGSVCLMVDNVLFTGDTLFAGSMGRTDFPGGSERDIMGSLKRLGSLEGDRAVLPGHMGTSTLSAERQSNPYLIMAMGR